MLDNKTLVKIKNRYNGFVTYSVPDMNNLTRTFSPNETKAQITVEEIRMLNGQTGGRRLLEDFLVIVEPQELIEELFPGKLDTQPEYAYGDKEITYMLESATVDAFKDFIDFAPLGILEIVKEKAVSLPLQSYDKRQYMLEKLDYDVDAAIKNDRDSKEGEEIAVDRPQRRVQPAASAAPKTQPIIVK